MLHLSSCLTNYESNPGTKGGGDGEEEEKREERRDDLLYPKIFVFSEVKTQTWCKMVLTNLNPH